MDSRVRSPSATVRSIAPSPPCGVVGAPPTAPDIPSLVPLRRLESKEYFEMFEFGHLLFQMKFGCFSYQLISITRQR